MNTGQPTNASDDRNVKENPQNITTLGSQGDRTEDMSTKSDQYKVSRGFDTGGA
jgi:hypothetical protein